MDIDLHKLKELALAATPGPWCAGFNNYEAQFEVIEADGGFRLALGDQRECEYIAYANPVVVLELVERVRVAECLADARMSKLICMPDELIVISIKDGLPSDSEGMSRFGGRVSSIFQHSPTVAILHEGITIVSLSDSDLRRIGLVKAIPADKKREAFEAWAKEQDYFAYDVDEREYSQGELLERDGSNDGEGDGNGYADAVVHAAWLAWQAAR